MVFPFFRKDSSCSCKDCKVEFKGGSSKVDKKDKCVSSSALIGERALRGREGVQGERTPDSSCPTNPARGS